jgi:hypothetical protein
MRLAAPVLALALLVAAKTRAASDAGSYRVMDEAAATAALEAALAETLAGLHPGMREVFAAELRRSAAPYRELRLEPTEGALHVVIDGTALDLPADGSARAATGPEGRRVRVSQRREGPSWVIVLTAGRAVREDRLTPTEDGLASEVRFRTPLLPRPLVYRYLLVPEAE